MRRINIVQGDHQVVTKPDIVLSTLLGSCIAVCLHDPVAKVGGMNHFLLGEPGGDHQQTSEMQRYGVHAMELLINGLMAVGAVRDRLRAHIYGGANMISGLGQIGSSNASFARRFMETEGISIGHCDLGGKNARRVEFMPYDGRSRCTQAKETVPVATPVRAPLPGGDLELF